jgi:hypothetical protein
MDTQIIAALLTVVLTVIAAVSGYFLREWLTRSKPFVSVFRIEGSSRRGAARVTVTDKSVRASKKSHLFDALGEKSRLNEVFDTLSAAKDIDSKAQEIVDLIDSFHLAVTNRDQIGAQGQLEELMLDEDFDKWVCSLIGEKTIAIPLFDQNSPMRIEFSEEKNVRGGTFAIGFPGNTLRFGSGLNNFTLYKSSVKAFIELISRLEFVKISEVLDAVAQELRKEIAISKDLISPLQEIVDQYSQWSFRLYVANLGHAPFLIQTDAQVEIKDQNGGHYKEACTLILLKKQDEEKKLRRVKADSPFVVHSQGDVTFDFVTTRTQSEMSDGDTIRSMFRKGSAQCRITFVIERPGHSRSVKVTSDWTKFLDTREKAA